MDAVGLAEWAMGWGLDLCDEAVGLAERRRAGPAVEGGRDAPAPLDRKSLQKGQNQPCDRGCDRISVRYYVML